MSIVVTKSVEETSVPNAYSEKIHMLVIHCHECAVMGEE